MLSLDALRAQNSNAFGGRAPPRHARWGSVSAPPDLLAAERGDGGEKRERKGLPPPDLPAAIHQGEGREGEEKGEGIGEKKVETERRNGRGADCLRFI